MISYTIRRILIIIPTLFVITFLVFLGLELTPGDAVSYMVSPDALANISQESLEQLRDSLGLNDPFIVRYFKWIGGIIKGEFGYSLSSGVPISEIVFDRLPATLELSIAALLISTFLGSILGIISALKKATIIDNILTFLGMIGVSIPQFFFGLVAILIFSLRLGWLPVGGRLLPGHEAFLDTLPHLVLPSLVLGLTMTAGVMRYARGSMLDILNKEYIKTARSTNANRRFSGDRTSVSVARYWKGICCSCKISEYTLSNDDSAIFCISYVNLKFSYRFIYSYVRSKNKIGLIKKVF